MANSKISALTAATTPVAGTETLPIVQSGGTKKVSIDDLTAGRSPSMNYAILNNGIYIRTGGVNRWLIQKDGSDDLYIYRYDNAGAYAGNPITISRSNGQVRFENGAYQGTAGTGFNFTANSAAAGMTSQLLNWYEEGTFTPTIVGTSTTGTATYGLQSAKFTRIGRMVYFALELIWSSGTGTGNLRVGGLPYTCGANNCGVSIGDIENVALTASYTAGAYVAASSTQIVIREFQVGGGGNNPVAYDAAGTLRIGGCYYV